MRGWVSFRPPRSGRPTMLQQQLSVDAQDLGQIPLGFADAFRWLLNRNDRK